MTAFNPIPPRRAVAALEKAGIGNASRVLADFCSAGTVKSYARSIVTGAPAVGRKQDRDITILPELWGHIIDNEKVDDVFTRGSVELFGPGVTFGQPHIAITGIRFNEDGVNRLAKMHGVPADPSADEPKRRRPAQSAETATPTPAPTAEESPPVPTDTNGPQPVRPRPPAPTISPDAELITVEQAAVMIGCGRSKAWGLVAKGELEGVRHGKRMTRVTVASVRAWIERNKK